MENNLSTPPPIGIMPKDIFFNNCKIKRYKHICLAIERYQEANVEIPESWLEELNELESEIDNF